MSLGAWGDEGNCAEVNDSTPCHCGHVFDEHDPACTVEGCKCVYFEAEPQEPDDE